MISGLDVLASSYNLMYYNDQIKFRGYQTQLLKKKSSCSYKSPQTQWQAMSAQDTAHFTYSIHYAFIHIKLYLLSLDVEEGRNVVQICMLASCQVKITTFCYWLVQYAELLYAGNTYPVFNKPSHLILPVDLSRYYQTHILYIYLIQD